MSFDQQQRAEQFVFAKLRLPLMQAPEMSETEQAALLEKCRFGQSWLPPDKYPEGKQWVRSDQGAAAFYLHVNRWLILMTPDGVEENIRVERDKGQ